MKKSSVSQCVAANPDSDSVVDGAARVEHRQEEGEELPAEGGNQDSGEAVLRRALPSPIMPTVSEIREHKTTHLPYRSWCDECVEAFAREWPHLTSDGSCARTIPVIHMDYAYLTEKGLFRRSELSDEELKRAITCIVASCSSSKSPFMHVVDAKERVLTSLRRSALSRTSSFLDILV